MSNLIVEFDKNGNYIKIAPTNTDLLIKPENELLEKNVTDVLEPVVAQQFLTAISQCIQSRKLNNHRISTYYKRGRLLVYRTALL